MSIRFARKQPVAFAVTTHLFDYLLLNEYNDHLDSSTTSRSLGWLLPLYNSE